MASVPLWAAGPLLGQTRPVLVDGEVPLKRVLLSLKLPWELSGCFWCRLKTLKRQFLGGS